MASEKTYIAKELVKIMYQPLEKFRQLDNVRYYFDGVERDSLDATGVSRRNGELLALRSELLKLSEVEFDAVLKTFWGVVKASSGKEDGKSGKSKSPTYEQSKQLYNETRSYTSGNVEAVA